MKITISHAISVLNISGAITEDSIKRAYRSLANKLHPDRNPGNAKAADEMKLVNAAYHFIKTQNLVAIQRAAAEAHDDNLVGVIASLNQLSGIKYEQIGRWVWITGDTRPHKEILKALGCMWSRQKQLWYFRPNEHNARHNRRTHEQDELREKFGTSGERKSAGMAELQA
ncbi:MULTISPECIES: J domain-containing protein [Erwiniaceae]|uniref:J domain-containing protein n=1 Tax=Erwiniaceae TaxID=1903409 RepID=UPI00226B1217|nr:DnaJ domain-containing protein [Erwinia psidii]MCX8959344.1 molecular chaperone DnaJ [Erwinia psidii]MCX8963015.1 molecular chaperone DnaJ [Erwinia psidii]